MKIDIEKENKEDLFNESNYKFIYQGDNTSLILYKNEPLIYIDYDNFDFADFDNFSEKEINDKILEIIMSDLYESKQLLY